MRRKEREIIDIDDKLALLDACKVCRLGLSENNIPYVVPLNFGYTFCDNKLTLFFHSAREGKKIDILRSNPLACFEVDGEHELKKGELACEYGFSFASVIGFGKVSFVTDREEKINVLGALMRHQTGKKTSFAYNDAMLNSVAVFKLEVSEFTGKRNKR